MIRTQRILVAVGVVLACAGLPGDFLHGTRAPSHLAVSEVERAALSLRIGERSGGRVRLYVAREGRADLVGERAFHEGAAEFDSVPVGRAWLLVDVPAMARHTQELTLEPGPNSETLVLQPGRDVNVQVVSEAGEALAGVWVHGAADGPMLARARTDGTGHALLQGVRMAVAHVEASLDGKAEGDGWLAPGASQLVVQVRPMARVRVRVLHADGTVAPRAWVDAVGTRLWPARVAEAQADGSVELRGLRAGLLWVRARTGVEVSEEASVDLHAGDAPELVLKLQPGRFLSVKCTDTAGAAVADAQLTMTREGLGPFPEDVMAGRSGVVKVGPLLPGPLSVRAEAPGYVPEMVRAEADASELSVVLSRGGRVRVRVRDSSGNAIASARVSLAGRDEHGVPYARTAESQGFLDALRQRHAQPGAFLPAGELGVVPGPVPPIVSAARRVDAPAPLEGMSDAQGEVVFDAVPLGDVRASVHHADYSEGQSATVRLQAGSPVDLMVTLVRGGALEGRLVDASGKAAEGYEIRLIGSVLRTETTDARGHFAFRNVSERAVLTVQDRAEPTLSLLRAESLVPDGKTVQLELALPAEGSPLNVRVTDTSGKPVSMAQVSGVSMDARVPRRSTEFTGDDGYAHLAGFRGLEARIDVDAPGYVPRALYTDVRTTEGVVKLSLGITARGRVLSSAGRPIEGALVELRQGPLFRQARSDAAGAFRTGALGAGPLSWRATASGFSAAHGVTELRASSAGSEAELPKFELLREACVSGVVRDLNGQAVAGAQVVSGVPHRYRPSDAQEDSVRTAAGGGYRFCGAGAGPLVLRAVRDGYKDGATRTVRLAPGDVLAGIDLQTGAQERGASEPEHGGLAITLGEDSSVGAVLVVRVYHASEAERAGLLSGDILLRVDGHDVRTLEQARKYLSGAVGDEVVMHVERDGHLVGMRVTRELVRR